MVLKCENIAISIDRPVRSPEVSQGMDDNENGYIIVPWGTFQLDNVGIYTLEGQNQVGKSVLIKSMMGVLPPRVRSESKLQIKTDSHSFVVENVRDAMSNGLVAVFQDDQLIPTMTVKQQLILKHGTPTLLNYLLLALSWIHHQLLKLLRKISGTTSLSGIDTIVERTLGWWERIKPDENRVYPHKEVTERAAKLLTSYGIENPKSEILERYPHELSGGAKAIAKLVNAQLVKEIRVLFLDEAFSGIQQSRGCPNLRW